jgi:hypothetical protein
MTLRKSIISCPISRILTTNYIKNTKIPVKEVALLSGPNLTKREECP